MKHPLKPVAVVLLTSAVAIGCATGVDNAAGRKTVYQDNQAQGMVSGLGIESRDIVGMTDRLVREILQSPGISNHARAPRIIVDSAYFNNQSAQRIDKDLILNRMRVQLQKAAGQRLTFVARQYAQMVEKERALKRAEQVDTGTTGLARATMGGDYRLVGTINSMDARSTSNGAVERYTQVTMQLVDLETMQGVWSGIFDFTKAGQDDAIYR